MRRIYHLFVKLIIFTIFFIVFYNYISLKNVNSEASRKTDLVKQNTSEPLHVVHLWCIVVKVEEKEAALLRKFRTFLKSLLHHSRHSTLSLNVLTDAKSKLFVDATIVNITGQLGYTINEVIHRISAASSFQTIV